MAETLLLRAEKEDAGASGSQREARRKRISNLWSLALQRKLSELSAHVEAAVIEARQLLEFKANVPPLVVAELRAEDRNHLESRHKGRMADISSKHCQGMLKLIAAHKYAHPFHTAVDTQTYKNYTDIVTEPCDLTLIRDRCEAVGHYKDPMAFANDLDLVFRNAKRYNRPGSDCFVMADVLHEFCQVQYRSLIAPRLVEEEQASLHEEVVAKHKRAEAINAQRSHQLETRVMTLMAFIDELQRSIVEAKSQAASACEPMLAPERSLLASQMQALKPAQVEACMLLVAQSQPHKLLASEALPRDAPPTTQPAPPLPPAPAPGRTTVGAHHSDVRCMTLDLAALDALVLRQLQHLVSLCRTADRAAAAQPAAHSRPAVSGGARGVSDAGPLAVAAGTQPGGTAAGGPVTATATIASSPAAAAAAGGTGHAPIPGKPQGMGDAVAACSSREAGGTAAASAAAAAADATAAGMDAVSNPAAPGGAATSPACAGTLVVAVVSSGDAEGSQPTVPPITSTCTGVTQPVPSLTAAGGDVVMAEQAISASLANGAALPLPNRREFLISDVRNGSAESISALAGVLWPGLPLGAGSALPSIPAITAQHGLQPVASGDRIRSEPPADPITTGQQCRLLGFCRPRAQPCFTRSHPLMVATGLIRGDSSLGQQPSSGQHAHVALAASGPGPMGPPAPGGPGQDGQHQAEGACSDPGGSGCRPSSPSQVEFPGGIMPHTPSTTTTTGTAPPATYSLSAAALLPLDPPSSHTTLHTLPGTAHRAKRQGTPLRRAPLSAPTPHRRHHRFCRQRRCDGATAERRAAGAHPPHTRPHPRLPHALLRDLELSPGDPGDPGRRRRLPRPRHPPAHPAPRHALHQHVSAVVARVGASDRDQRPCRGRVITNPIIRRAAPGRIARKLLRLSGRAALAQRLRGLLIGTLPKTAPVGRDGLSRQQRQHDQRYQQQPAAAKSECGDQ
ncbi:MAG: hypothetical protein WDW38_008988 [Sanguina aurantia]